ncbi:MAG: hypothetical protein EOO04_22875, partial [Chitinophagaceae bacterium]
MKTQMKTLYIGIVLAAVAFASCSKLDQVPQSTASKEAIFSSENGLKLYTNSFYGMDFLPKNSTTQDAMSDYLAVREVQLFIREGGFAANNSSGWGWTDLRNINYFIYSDVKGGVTTHLTGITYDNFLTALLQGTEYTYKNENGIYLIGERKLEGLRSNRIIQLQHRSLDTIQMMIPAEWKKGVEIKEFREQNT